MYDELLFKALQFLWLLGLAYINFHQLVKFLWQYKPTIVQEHGRCYLQTGVLVVLFKYIVQMHFYLLLTIYDVACDI